jgi:hypothetical protein
MFKNLIKWIGRKATKIVIRKAAKKIEKMQGSWKTTLYGLLAALGVISGQIMNLVDGDPTTIFSVELLITTIISAIGMFGLGSAARDRKVTSEEEMSK